jgi:hypothetical protein
MIPFAPSAAYGMTSDPDTCFEPVVRVSTDEEGIFNERP